MHNYKSILALMLLASLAGCRKDEPSQEKTVIAFTADASEEFTKSGAVRLQEFNVSAYISGSGNEHFPSSLYSWNGSSYVTAAVRYWPQGGESLDFYATSPSSYLDSTNTAQSLTAGKSFTVNGLGGTTDILAATKTASSSDPSVNLAFGHKLTRVKFNAMGSNTSYRYEILGISLKTGSSSTFSLGESEAWTQASKPHTYSVPDAAITIPAGSSSPVSAGSALYLIPAQTSASVNVKYKIYEGENLVEDKSNPGIDFTPDVSSWGISASILYKLTINSEGKGIGFSVEVEDWGDDSLEEKTVRDSIRPVPLKFTADSIQTVTLYNSNNNNPKLDYSWDGVNWESWNYDSLQFGTGAVHPAVYFRGTNANGLCKSDTKYSTFKFKSSKTAVNCSGNIMSLIRHDCYLLEIPGDYCFRYLFKNAPVVSSPDLPATTLKTGCYSYMFENCTLLSKAPALQADNLADNCYERMFSGCSSLVKAPELPAKSLTKSCYSSMFRTCSKLSKAPALPVTVLKDNCYDNMFRDCTSLNETPDLSITSVGSYSCRSMFNGCSNLKETGSIDIDCESSFDYSFAYMFANCPALQDASGMKISLVNVGEGSFNETFANYGGGSSIIDQTALKYAPEINISGGHIDSYAFSCMFSKCIVLSEVKNIEISCNDAGDYAFKEMFDDTYKLNDGISFSISGGNVGKLAFSSAFSDSGLSSINLDIHSGSGGVEAFKYMFYRCSRLSKVNGSIVFSSDTGKGVFYAMFSNCSSLTHAADTIKAKTFGEEACLSMFYGCSILPSTPVFIGNPNGTKSFCQTFWYCSNLSEVTVIFDNTPATSVTSGWFWASPAKSGNFYTNMDLTPWNLTIIDGCVVSGGSADTIPNGWRVIKIDP